MNTRSPFITDFKYVASM